MPEDVFGNLEEWGRVLERLAELERSGLIEKHQDDLVRLLRYPDNWRLREAALESVTAIRGPTESLIREACNIMMDDDLYYQVRILAAEALVAAMDRLAEGRQAGAPRLKDEVREQMHALLDSPQAPVFHQAILRILPKIE